MHACNLRTQEAEAGGLNSKQMKKQKQTFAAEIWKRVKGRCGLGVTDEPARSKPHAAGQALSGTCSLAILLPASTLTTHKPNLGEPLGGAHSEEHVQHLVHPVFHPSLPPFLPVTSWPSPRHTLHDDFCHLLGSSLRSQTSC